MYIPYHEQFHIQAEQAWRIYEDSRPLKGWDFSHTVYGSGNWVFRKECLWDITGCDNLSVKEAEIYFVCDGYQCPVGALRNKDYAFLLKKGIYFPKLLLNNGYEWWEDAEDALRQIKQYYQRIANVTTTKKDAGQFTQYRQDIWITPEIQKRLSMKDGIAKGAKKKKDLSSLERELLFGDL